MNVIVTGASGFVGAALCRGLLAAGHSVTAFHRPSSNLRLLESLDVRHALGDLTQPETLQAAFEGQEVVFHAAAWMGNSDPGRLYAVTVEGTRGVVEACRQAGVRRLVHTSSAAALGVPRPGVREELDEHHTWNFRPELYPYGYAKYLAELEVQKGVAQGLDAVIVNPALVIGPGDAHRQSTSIIQQVAARKVGVSIEGGINIVHIDDVVAGELAAMERGRRGERYLLASENLTYSQFLGTIAAVAHVAAPSILLPGRVLRALAGPARMFERFLDLPVEADTLVLAGSYFWYTAAKARNELGVDTPKSAEEAISDAYAWFRQGGAG